MSRTLVYRTNKEIDKCAELLRNIRTIQESRQDAKSATLLIHEKKQIDERRLSFSTNQKPLTSNNRHNSKGSRKHIQKSTSNLQTQTRNDEKLVRSSSYGDLTSLKSKLMSKQQTQVISEQFLIDLTRIKNLSKQLRTKYSNSINNSECDHLWNQLEKSIQSTLSYPNHHLQFQLSLKPLRTEINQLRKELQTTSTHLHECDLIRRNNNKYVDLQKKFDTTQIHCTQLLLHNEQLKRKCCLLEEENHNLEENNNRLVQQLTQQNIKSMHKHRKWISTDNPSLLCQENLFLKDKLYDIYDNLSTLYHQNQTLENVIEKQKEELLFYKQQFNHVKKTAEQLLIDLEKKSIEDKIKKFLNNILIDQHHSDLSKKSHPFEPLHTVKSPTNHLHPSINSMNKKSRSNSFFITPNVLNDTKALSKFQNNQNLLNNIQDYSSSSSTIDDADSTLTSPSSTSIYYQHEKQTILYNNFPISTIPKTIHLTKTLIKPNQNNDTSSELNQISNLTSKMFSSADEEEFHDPYIQISTSSSSTRFSNPEKLIHM